jgi:Arc/MetJ family transcription regulator
MRTNIDLDDELLTKAMNPTQPSTKKATVEEALRILVKRHDLKKVIDDLAGIGWEGNLDEMREGRFWDDDGRLDK